ncbi:Branched-chain amino acid transport system / permease component [Neomoorella glycerini]|uniref:Branched-chain amino acid transport system / permease component n=1 Tax=Neomoorella glycerini TaxID=55779 RepID=A0A6I5ZNC3_9FIRM|nr:ABC transporter permease [Moorella glycerini]QGP91097.1 Branched-chain amino acid transport system / permease component [Moorella glycerini]
MFEGAFSGLGNFGASLVLAIPLMLAGLGIALAFRSGIFNIGAEGQLYLGAMAATYFGARYHDLPFIIHLPLALAASCAAGALWALIPGYLKVRRGFNEVITTILLNYIGVHFVNYAVNSFLKDPATYAPQSPPVAATARLPKLLPGTELNAGLFLGLLAAGILFVIIYKTDWGYQLRAVGSNPEAARTAGMNADRTLIGAMIVSGSLAGLAGAVQILGYQYILLQDFSPNTGYDAIAVALLGKLNPLGTVMAAIFFGALRNGANTMQILTGIPVTIVYVIQAIIILCVLGFTRLKLNFIRFSQPREVDF